MVRLPITVIILIAILLIAPDTQVARRMWLPSRGLDCGPRDHQLWSDFGVVKECRVIKGSSYNIRLVGWMYLN